MTEYDAIYVGDEFPDYRGVRVTVIDSEDLSGNPCYAMILHGEEIGDMYDEDFDFLD